MVTLLTTDADDDEDSNQPRRPLLRKDFYDGGGVREVWTCTQLLKIFCFGKGFI